MFFMGIGPGDRDTGSLVVVIRTFLKNIKKHYEVKELISLPHGLSDPEIISDINRLYNNNAYISNKRIFSQDKRPTRTIRAHPWLVVYGGSGGDGLVQALRARKIPAECIIPRQSPGWEKSVLGKALGDDYQVCRAALLETIVNLHAENRLAIQTEAPRLMQELEQQKTGVSPHTAFPAPVSGAGEPVPSLMVLALALWFREAVPYNRPYKA